MENNSTWEAEEELKDQARIAAIKSKIEALKGMVLTHEATVKQLEATIRVVESIVIEQDKFFEFTAEATETKQDVLDALNHSLETRERLDKEDTERKAEADEKMRQEALKPDKEKFIAWVERLKINDNLPVFEDESIRILMFSTLHEIGNILQEALVEADKL